MEECSEASLYSSEDEILCPGPLFRVKMFVMGDVGCGKTSLVQSLIGPNPKLNDLPTDGVNVELWYPFKTSKNNEKLLDRKLTGEEHHLILEVWDMTGRQVCQHAHQMYLTKGALFLLLYNRVDHTSCDSVLPLYDIIQQAAPGSPVIIASTKADKSPPDGNRATLPTGPQILEGVRRHVDNTRFYLKRELDEMKLLSRETQTRHSETGSKSKKNESRPRSRGEDTSPVIRAESETCHALISRLADVPGKVHDVSSVTGQGIDELKKTIFRTVLDPLLFPHLDRTIKPSTISLYDEILKLRERDFVLLTWEQFRDMASQLAPSDGDDTLEEETAFLQTIGGLLDYRLSPAVSNTRSSSSGQGVCSETQRFICIYPGVLSNSICCFLVDDDKRAFRFESCRFWPKDSGFKRPDPQVLSKVLEAIPREGLIRESLLPLLWQDSNLYEDQVLHMVRVLTYLGLLVNYCTVKTYCEGLALPYYPHLSVHRCLYAVHLDLLPNNRPQLNWTPKPFKGDLQITVCYVFPTSLPLGVAKQLLAHCLYVGQAVNSYRHIWKYGVLQRIGEVTLCAEHSTTQFNLSCRVNADEPGQEDSAVQLLWTSLAPLMISIHNFLGFWPGLFYKLVLLPLGQSFYNEERVDSEPMVTFLRCLTFWLADKKYSFKDGEVEREINLRLLFPFRGCPTPKSVDDWLRFVVSKRELVLPPEGANSIPEVAKQKQTTLKVNPLFLLSKGSLRLKGKKKKSVEVKWKLEQAGVKAEQQNQQPTFRPPTMPATNQEQHGKHKSPDPDETKQTQLQKSSEGTTELEATNQMKEQPSLPAANGGPEMVAGSERMAWTEEEEVKEATRIASGFVAAVMASAVAEFISTECDSNTAYKEVVSAAQVAAARVTAEAARAAQTGDIDGAARAVLQAVKAVESAVGTTGTTSAHGHIRSKLCSIL